MISVTSLLGPKKPPVANFRVHKLKQFLGENIHIYTFTCIVYIHVYIHVHTSRVSYIILKKFLYIIMQKSALKKQEESSCI